MPLPLEDRRVTHVPLRSQALFESARQGQKCLKKKKIRMS